MLSFRRHRNTHNEPGRAHGAAGAALRLQTNTGQDVLTVPPEIEEPSRHMLTRLTRDERFPAQVAIVSALRQEGVSLMTLALATVLANDTAQRVCVVDLNWWWPNAWMQQAARQGRGIADVLSLGTPLEDVLVSSGHKNLTLLPAGTLAPAARPASARSAGLTELLAELGQRFDQLLLDVPAILATSDAIPLASLSQGACLVVRQGVSSASLVKQAKNELSHVPMLGVTMNRVQIRTPRWILRWIPQD